MYEDSVTTECLSDLRGGGAGGGGGRSVRPLGV